MNAFVYLAGQVALLLVVAAGIARMVGATKWSAKLFWSAIGIAIAAPFVASIALTIAATIEEFWFLVYPAMAAVMLAVVVAAKLRLDARLGAVAKAFPPPKTSMKERLSGEE